MLKYLGGVETIHFANWLLHSGHVDPAKLVRETVERAWKKVPDDLPEDYPLDLERELAEMLREGLAGWAAEFAPKYRQCDRYAFSGSLEHYRGGWAFGLIAPLLASAIDRIDLNKAAEMILETRPLLNCAGSFNVRSPRGVNSDQLLPLLGFQNARQGTETGRSSISSISTLHAGCQKRHTAVIANIFREGAVGLWF